MIHWITFTIVLNSNRYNRLHCPLLSLICETRDKNSKKGNELKIGGPFA